MAKEIIKKGDKYNRLTAVRFDHRNKHGSQYWLFRCSCGNKKVIAVANAKNGSIKSCGCLHKPHGMRYTPEYSSWQAMKNRCLDKNTPAYKNYGSRGITVCKRWLKFQNFYKDMGKRPFKTSIDRIDNNKGYYKENCRWSTRTEQNNNTRNSHFLTFNGKTQTIAQWANELDIKYHTLYTRLNRKWSIKKTLSR